MFYTVSRFSSEKFDTDKYTWTCQNITLKYPKIAFEIWRKQWWEVMGQNGMCKKFFFSKLFRPAEYRIDFQNLTPTTLYVRRTVWRPAKSNWADWTVQLISEKYRRVGLGPGGVRRWLVNRRGCGPWWKISQAVCVPLSTLLAAG